MIKSSHSSSVLCFALALTACGTQQPSQYPHGTEQSAPTTRSTEQGAFDSSAYQVGSELSRPSIDSFLGQSNAAEAKEYGDLARSVARIGGGTAFLLGQIQGVWIMATNRHVMPTPGRCNGQALHFAIVSSGSEQVFCDRLIGVWAEVDLALFAVAANTPAGKTFLAALTPLRFDWTGTLGKNRKLLTMGFGGALNGSERHLTVNADSDCKIFSGDNEFRLSSDLDSRHSLANQVWSFAFGCDVSHGDSGSPIIDRDSHAILGMVWTGKFPKPAAVQGDLNSANLQDEVVWENLNLGTPAPKIRDVIEGSLSSFRGLDAAILRTLLD